MKSAVCPRCGRTLEPYQRLRDVKDPSPPRDLILVCPDPGCAWVEGAFRCGDCGAIAPVIGLDRKTMYLSEVAPWRTVCQGCFIKRSVR